MAAFRYKIAGNSKGFTVVEAAVVMVVGGMMAAGALKGMEMYQTSLLSATYMQVQSYSAATQAFITQYDALPGDMSNATTRIPTCTGTCADGNGDGMIGVGNVDINVGSAAGTEDEAGEFWYQLSAAGMLKNFTPTGALGTGWGKSLPPAPAGGGYMVRTMAGACFGGYEMTGLFIRWQATPWQNADAVVSPPDASYIDHKFDDGNPLDGKVQTRDSTGAAVTAADACRTAGITGNPQYAITSGQSCYMYFKIRETSGL